MREAKISEIFSSLQGEGVYVGVRQLFVRFYGCNMSCVFCDTKADSFETFTAPALMKKILEYREPYHSLSLTGGEPLLQADFIESFLSSRKKFCKKPVYLETNGTLPRELSRVIDGVDIVAMDFKLPSSTSDTVSWPVHEKFLKIAAKKKVFVKAVITHKTDPGYLLKMTKIVKKIDASIPIILQPVTTPLESERITDKSLGRFKKIIKKATGRSEVIPQMHKMMGIK